jgi:hypothetical protein
VMSRGTLDSYQRYSGRVLCVTSVFPFSIVDGHFPKTVALDARALEMERTIAG